MPKSYVDEIVARYLMKKGYLVSQGIWFPLDKQNTGKKVSGWSDIDIFAVKYGEPSLIIQCKSFSGTENSEKVVEKIINWFNNALGYLKNHPYYSDWVKDNQYKKVFVVNTSIRKTEKKLRESGIEVWSYKDILNKLLKELKNEQKTLKEEKGPGIIGKEEDILLRILSDMINREIIKIKEEK